MGAQNGKDLLVKVDMMARLFETIAGLRATRVSFNAEQRGCHQPGKPGRLARVAGRGRGEIGQYLGLGRVQGCAATDERARQIFFDGETPGFR